MKIGSVLTVGLALLCVATGASAQVDRKAAQARLKQYFEGRRVISKVDMPAARTGIDLAPEKSGTNDFSKIAKTIAQYGVSIRVGDRPMVTEVELSKDEIEFQLDGGGYGSSADSSAEPHVPSYPTRDPKSDYEKSLENEQKTTTDKERLRTIRRELDRERDRRERNYRRDKEEYDRALAYKEEYVREKRPTRGSRYNLKFKTTDTSTITPEELMRLLADYIDFSPLTGGGSTSPGETNGPAYSESGQPIGNTGGKPYLGDWRNGRGEVLRIDGGVLSFGRSAAMEYREVFKMASAGLYAIELLGNRNSSVRRFISITASDRDLKLAFYDSLDDLQEGVNKKGEETWTR